MSNVGFFSFFFFLGSLSLSLFGRKAAGRRRKKNRKRDLWAGEVVDDQRTGEGSCPVAFQCDWFVPPPFAGLPAGALLCLRERQQQRGRRGSRGSRGSISAMYLAADGMQASFLADWTSQVGRYLIACLPGKNGRYRCFSRRQQVNNKAGKEGAVPSRVAVSFFGTRGRESSPVPVQSRR